MLELRRCLSDRMGNELAKLFHIEVKDLVRHGLRLAMRLPDLTADPGKLEFAVSKTLVDSHNEMLSHICSDHSRGIVHHFYNLVIYFCEGDEGWRLLILEALKDLKSRELPGDLEPRPEYWRRDGRDKKDKAIRLLDSVRVHTDGNPEATEALDWLDMILKGEEL